jgi:hypothetical protein
LHFTKVQNRSKVTEKWEWQRNFFRWCLVKRLLWFQFSLLFLSFLFIKYEDLKQKKSWEWKEKGKRYSEICSGSWKLLSPATDVNEVQWILNIIILWHILTLYLTAWQEAKASKDVS